jgi:hypoxanthine phosphoribosyltransferase
MTDIPDDAIKITWEDAYDKSVKLAELIKNHCEKTGERFDAIVVIPRGGYYPANIVSRRLGFEADDMLQASIGSYKQGTTDRLPDFRLGQMPSDKDVQGKRLLIIDEVCDTGYTLAFLTKRLQDQGAALVRSGVLHYKQSLTRSGFEPDWSVAKTDKWILYPWEAHETRGPSPVKA